jgi:hypothetical protein
MKMAVVPPVRGDVCGHVPAAASQVRAEHAAPEHTGGERREAAGHHVLLMTVNDRCAPYLAEHGY